MALFLDPEEQLLFLVVKIFFRLVGVQGEFGLVEQLLILRFLEQRKQAWAFGLAEARLVK